MASPRLALAIVETLEQAHDLQRELSRAGVQAFVTRQEWQGRPRPVVGYYATGQEQAALLGQALQAIGVEGEIFFDQPVAEVGWSVVFGHTSLQVAHMMRNLLDHHQIESKVLETGVRAHEFVGLFEVFHVVVPNDREAQAGEVVDEFLLRRLAERTGTPTPVEQQGETIDAEEFDSDILIAWPRCPQCGQPRETSCPKCAHIGHHLPQAETPVDADDLAAIRKEPTIVELNTGMDATRAEPQDDSLLRPQPQDDLHWVLCPICDWLFQPRYYRRCAWCSHNFGDGLDVQQPPANFEQEPVNLRMLLLAGGLLVLMLAMLIYFGSLGD